MGWEDPLEEGSATHSSVLAWRIPLTEEPGGPQSKGCKESDRTEVTARMRGRFIWLKTTPGVVTFRSANITPLTAPKAHREIGERVKIFKVY